MNAKARRPPCGRPSRVADFGTWRALGASIAPAFVFVASSLAGCEPSRTPEAPTISLRLRGTPTDATVVVDDEPLGTLDFVAAHGVALPVGLHQITVRADGYFPWDTEVDAKRGAPPISLEVTLNKVPD